MIKLQGILGFNCGETQDINYLDKRSNDYNRYKERGYLVKGGIETLRGFAPIEDLAKASIIDRGYQRSKDKNHIKDISVFLDEGRVLSKFLPEVILVGNKDSVNLTPFTPSGNVSPIILGEINNLEIYSIEVDEKSLKRIDGNHRLEAGAKKNLLISFAIILWPEWDESYQENRDNEAFLFHFLNGKAKKLTPEENYKGLATSKTWSLEELKHVNPVIPYLQIFLKQIEKSTVFNKDYFSDGPLSQIAEVLEELGDFTISNERFKKIINSTFLSLNDFHKFPYLKSEFNCLLPQLAFINFYYDNPLEHLISLSNWLKKYKYEKGSFENAKNLYDIADKQLKVVHLKVFVAMPFWKKEDGTGDLQTVIKYNKIYQQALVKVVGNENPHINLELIPIMLRRGKAVRIDSQILKEIEEADIFIGDITENNYNVIFEIGYASALAKPSIILKKKTFTEPPPFDIDKILYKQYEYDDLNFEKSLTSIININLTEILKTDFDLIINKSPNKEVLKENTPKSEITNQKKEPKQNLTESTKAILRDEEYEEFEEIFIEETKSTIGHIMKEAEWDYENRIIEIASNGKIIKIKSYKQLENTLEKIAKNSVYPLILEEGEDRIKTSNNIDWRNIVQNVLSSYRSEFVELHWI